mmetsp:Transcript_10921/g.32019  ORF Transcript_10921/g.32019 Transcript_10921/m.32019 type:complete len:84 (+) Transcript_10921:1709-1960(+)
MAPCHWDLPLACVKAPQPGVREQSSQQSSACATGHCEMSLPTQSLTPSILHCFPGSATGAAGEATRPEERPEAWTILSQDAFK